MACRKYYQACLLQTSIAIYGSTSLYIAVIQIRRGLWDKPGLVSVERTRSQKWSAWPAAEDIWKDFLYFTSGYFIFLLHTSQYLSIKISPSPTLNRASTVAKLPQLTQNFIFPIWRTSVKDLNDVNTFSIFILLFHLMRSKCGLFFITQCGSDTNKNVLKYYRKLILNKLNHP